MFKEEFVKLVKLGFVIIFLLGSYAGITQNEYYDFKISFKPEIVNNNNIEVKPTLHKPNSSCVTNSGEIYLNTFILNYVLNDKQKKVFYLYNPNKQIIYMSSKSKSKKLSGRAVVNIGYISTTGNFCKNFTKQIFSLNHHNNLSINALFKGFVVDFLKKNKQLNDTLNYELVIVPLLDKDDKKVNVGIRKFIKTNDQEVQKRQMYFVWNKGEVAELPAIFTGCDYKIIPLFGVTKHKNQNKVIVGKSIKTQNTNKKPKAKKTTVTKAVYDTSYLTIHFQGYCPDGLTINYTVFSNDGTNLSGAKVATIHNNTITLSKKEIRTYASSNVDLSLELAPDEYGYYITTLRNKNQVKTEDSSETVSFTLNNSFIELYFSNIPQYYIFYIDANSFSEKIKLSKYLQEKFNGITKNNDRFFIYLANGNRPIYSSSKEGLNNLLSRLTTQGFEVGSLNEDWSSISENIDQKLLSKIDSESVHITLCLSKNIYLLHNEDFVQTIVDYMGDEPWNVKVITDFKVKKKIKIPGDIDFGTVTYKRIK